jgi:hypothetical protein
MENLPTESQSRILVGGCKVGDGDRLLFTFVDHRSSLACCSRFITGQESEPGSATHEYAIADSGLFDGAKLLRR